MALDITGHEPGDRHGGTELAGGVKVMSEANVKAGLDEANVPLAAGEGIVRAAERRRSTDCAPPRRSSRSSR
jgi:hypothetical protein